MIVDDSNVWESLERDTNKYTATVNELVEIIRKFFIDFDKLMENLVEMEQHAISDQVRAELSRQKDKRHPPLKLIQTYSFTPSAKKNLTYQRRNY